MTMLGNYEHKFTQKKTNAPKQLINKMLKGLKVSVLADWRISIF